MSIKMLRGRPSMRVSSSEVAESLKLRGIKPSYQRMKIYEFLLNNRIHPTVDEIFKTLTPEIPTLSKTTIYNTLNLFVEKKLINVIVIDEKQTRYDVEQGLHGHFKCNTCEKIFDIELNQDILNSEKLENFEIDEYHFYFKGNCKKCNNK